MVHEGKYFPPEPYQNLENAIRKTQQAYLMYRMRNAPEDRLELLRQYMEDCQSLLMKSNTPEETPEQLAEKLAMMGQDAMAEQVKDETPPPNMVMPEEPMPQEEIIEEQVQEDQVMDE